MTADETTRRRRVDRTRAAIGASGTVYLPVDTDGHKTVPMVDVDVLPDHLVPDVVVRRTWVRSR